MARSWPLWLSIAVCTTLGLLFVAQTATVVDGATYYSLADDVMISMTYARNLAEGYGLVWVPGEPPVEGFSNPLWTVWLAALHVAAPGDQIPALLTALSGLACLLIGLAGTDRVLNRLGADEAGRVFALLSAATLYSAAFWSIRGFEVAALIAVFSWMLSVALDRRVRGLPAGALLGGLSAVAFLIRMDALAMAVPIIALRALAWDRTALREMAAAFAMTLAAVAALEAARYAYFGDLLPNTSYLKLSGVPLWARLRAGLAADVHAAIDWLPLVLLALAPPALVRVRERLFPIVGVICVIAAQVAYAAWIGGDAWEWSGFPNRFVTTAAYAICAAAGIGAGLALERVKVPAKFRPAAAALAALVASAWMNGPHWADTFSGRGFQIREETRLIADGIALRRGTAPGFTYAITWAGTIPYYAPGRRPIDLLGKMDPVIAHMRPNPDSGVFHPAHNKFDLDHSIGQSRPDAILHIVDESPEAMDRIRKWGYVETEGGWWIRSDARVTDRRLLAHRF